MTRFTPIGCDVPEIPQEAAIIEFRSTVAAGVDVPWRRSRLGTGDQWSSAGLREQS
jgi:hypothetical protein